MVWEALLERQVRAYGKVAVLSTTILPYALTAENEQRTTAPLARVWSTPKLNTPKNKNIIGKQWSIASVVAAGGGEIFRDHPQVAEYLMMKNTLSKFHFNTTISEGIMQRNYTDLMFKVQPSQKKNNKDAKSCRTGTTQNMEQAH